MGAGVLPDGVPSIAPSGLTQYSGDRFATWRGNIFLLYVLTEAGALLRLEPAASPHEVASPH